MNLDKSFSNAMAMSSDGLNNPKPGVLFHQSTKDSALLSKTQKGRCYKPRLPKKTLVRNTELAVHPTIYKSDAPIQDIKGKDEPSDPPMPPTGLYKTNLSAPCLNSALRLVKEMKQASQVKPPNALSAKLVDEGKVLQQVNFLYEERLYHDLVALTDVDVVEASSSRNTSKFRVREKDKEPKLSQFFTPAYSEEFRIPRNPPRRMNPEFSRTSDGFSVYERMRSWNVD